jgi:mxaD protein
MKLISATALALTVLASGYSVAAAPELHVHKTITINASADKVWNLVKDFNGLNNWHPAVAKDDIVEGTNNSVGAVRLLSLKGGGTIKEKLLAFDAKGHSFRYTIVEGVLPVSNYSSRLSVKSTGAGKSTVSWSGKFQRKNLGDNPGDSENDKTAVDTVTGVYQGGLDNLKKLAEAQ